MLFKFIGKYTGASESINAGGAPEKGGVTFVGREPAEVTDKALAERLSKNPEFEAVDGRTKAAKATKATTTKKSIIDESDLENEAEAAGIEA